MAFCKNCGAAMEDGAKYCPSCGADNAPVVAGYYQATENQYQPNQQNPAGGYQAPGSQYQPPNQNAYQNQNDYQAAGGQYGAQNTYGTASGNDHTAQFHPQDIASNKMMGVLAYLGILVLVPLLTQSAKQSPFARFHVNQGLVLLLAQVACTIVRGVVLAVVNVVTYSYGLYNLFSILFSLLVTALGVFALVGLIFAAQGKAKELPLIGKIHLVK